MAEVRTEQQWISYVENAFIAQSSNVTVPQNFMPLSGAVNLALRLGVTLILVDENFIFTKVSSGEDERSH